MISVRQLLEEKGSDVWSITPQTTTFEALGFMAEKNIGALLVVEEGRLVGVFSERDYARKVILKGKSSSTTTVGDLMTREVFTVRPEETIKDCMKLMTDNRIRHLPVSENDRLIGIITIGDVVNKIITIQRRTIDQLGQYISGSGYGA